MEDWQAYPLVLPSNTPAGERRVGPQPPHPHSQPPTQPTSTDHSEPATTMSESRTPHTTDEKTENFERRDEEKAKRKRRRTEKRKRAQAVYEEYESDKPNSSQTREWKPHRHIRGCPHWQQGCSFESKSEEEVAAHVANCPFEVMKAFIAKKDAQISQLTREVDTLKTSVHHLTRVLGELVAQQIPMVGGPRFNRSISTELYSPLIACGPDGSRQDLSELSQEILEVNRARRQIRSADIARQREVLAGGMKVAWTQTPAPRRLDLHDAVPDPIAALSSRRALSLLPPTLPITLRESSAALGIVDKLMSIHKTAPIRDIALFQGCVFTAGTQGIQIWQVTSVPSLRFVGKLSSEDCFSIAAGNIHLYSGHHKMIRVWNYNFSDGSLHFSSFDVETGSVRCLTMCGSYVYSSAETEFVQVWRTTAIGTDMPTTDSQSSLQRHTTLRGHHALVTTLCGNEDYLFSASKDCSVLVWSLSTHECVQKLTHPDGVLSLCIISSTTHYQLIQPVGRSPFLSTRPDEDDMSALVATGATSSPTARFRFPVLSSTPLALPPPA